jgi:adenosine deaminase
VKGAVAVSGKSRDLASLPKAHLHLHLEAGLRPSTLASLAAKYGTQVPQVRGFSVSSMSDSSSSPSPRRVRCQRRMP